VGFWVERFEAGRCWFQSVKSEKSKRIYDMWMRGFCKWLKVKSLDQLAKDRETSLANRDRVKQRKHEELLVKFQKHLEARGLSLKP